jgi:hypothetical protein
MSQDRFAPVYSQDWDVRVRAIESYLSNLASLPASVASAMQTGDFSGLVSSSSSSSAPGLVFDSLLDVTITSPVSGDLPVYSSAGWVNQQWTPGKLGVGTTLTPTHRFELEDGNYTAWFDGQNSNPLSGARGWHISKVKTVALPHTITWHVDGHSSWEIGMDFDTNNALSSGFGNADFVVAYDPTAGKNDAGALTGTGADIFRFSPAEASVAGDNYGRVGLGFRQGTPNTAGAAWFTVTGPPDVVGLNVSTNSTFSYGLKMVQRGAHNRALLNHNDKFAIGTDYAAANAQNYQLRDLVAGATRWFVDSSGRFQIGGTSPTAFLHLPAGAAGASNAPLKFVSGTSLTTAEAGAWEFDGTDFFATPIATRKKLVLAPTSPTAYTPTNVTTDRSYDANATTLDEIADVLGTLIADLQAIKAIG